MSNPHKPAWLNNGAETNANPEIDSGAASDDQTPPLGEDELSGGGAAGCGPMPPPDIWKILLEGTRKSNKVYLPLKGRVQSVQEQART